MGDRRRELLLSYGQLEAVLFDLYRAREEKQKSIIRSRYKNLQKLGLPSGDRPKVGKRTKYNIRQVCEWVIAFELLEFGFDQKLVVDILLVQFDRDITRLRQGEQNYRTMSSAAFLLSLDLDKFISRGQSEVKKDTDDRSFLIFTTNVMTGGWSPQYLFMNGVMDDVVEMLTRFHRVCLIDLTQLCSRLMIAIEREGVDGNDPKT